MVDYKIMEMDFSMIMNKIIWCTKADNWKNEKWKSNVITGC